MIHPALIPEHAAFRETARRFVARDILPHATAWDEAGEFPRELYRKAAAAGRFGLGFPEEYGGVPADYFYRIASGEEFAQAGFGGLSASLFSYTIGAPPIAAVGSEELKRRVLPAILSGDKISALCITEPSGGSGVANLRTTARRDGGEFVVQGEKAFINSGMRADYKPWRFAPAVPARPACRCSSSSATARASAARNWRKWAGGAPTPRCCTLRMSASLRPT